MVSKLNESSDSHATLAVDKLAAKGLRVETSQERRQRFTKVVCFSILIVALITLVIDLGFSIFVDWQLWSGVTLGVTVITGTNLIAWRLATARKNYLASFICIGSLGVVITILYWQAPYFAYYLVMLFVITMTQIMLGVKETLGIGSFLFISTLLYSIINHNHFFAPDGQLVIVDYGTFANWWLLIGAIAWLFGYLYNTVTRDNQILDFQSSELFNIQKQLLESEARYRGLSEASFEGIVIHNVDNWVLEVNQALTEMLGYPELEIVGKSLDKIIVDLVHFGAEVPYPHSTFLETQGSNEMVAIRKDGSHFPIEIQNRKYVYKTQDVSVIAIRDITSRKQIENQVHQQNLRSQALAKLSELLAEVSQDYSKVLDIIAQQLVEVIGDGCSIFLISADGVTLELAAIYHSNPEIVQAYRGMLNLSPLQISDGNAGQVFRTGQALLQPEVSLEQILATIKPQFQHLAAKYRIYSRVIVPLKAQGNIIGELALSRYLPGHSYTLEDQLFIQQLAERAALAIANARLYLNLAKELAERKAAEAALRQKEEQLRQAQRLEAIGRLAGSVAHDFNNLLTIIITDSEWALMELQIIEQTEKIGQVLESIEQIQKASEQAANLTRQLLVFSRKTILQPKIFDLNQIVTEIAKMVGRLIGGKIILTIQLDPQLGLIEADPSQIEQVLMNLLLNARDAMPQGGKLTIETTNVELDEEYASTYVGAKPGAFVMLRVSDTGEGMNPETIAYIFEPFFTTKEQGKGTGLGLATVYGIILQSGGSIRVNSVVGQGSTFWIYLPRLVS